MLKALLRNVLANAIGRIKLWCFYSLVVKRRAMISEITTCNTSQHCQPLPSGVANLTFKLATQACDGNPDSITARYKNLAGTDSLSGLIHLHHSRFAHPPPAILWPATRSASAVGRASIPCAAASAPPRICGRCCYEPPVSMMARWKGWRHSWRFRCAWSSSTSPKTRCIVEFIPLVRPFARKLARSVVHRVL